MESDEFEEQQLDDWYEHKTALMEKSLGAEHDRVMHAIIPFAVGGGLDLYYYPNGISGTGIATKELSELPDEGPSSEAFSCYELVMFTRHAMDLDAAKDPGTPFGKAHQNINRVLNLIANYAGEATLNPGETCEFPEEMEHVGGKCLLLAEYDAHSDEVVTRFGLLALIEIFRSEMQLAREEGADVLLSRLHEAGHYPYSDLDRDPVA